jgi:hypothetical protein
VTIAGILGPTSSKLENFEMAGNKGLGAPRKRRKR